MDDVEYNQTGLDTLDGARKASRGRVIKVNTSKTNVRPDRVRFQDIGKRTLAIKSVDGERVKDPVAITYDDAARLQKTTGDNRWLGGIENLKEEDLNATPQNSARAPRPLTKTAAARPVTRQPQARPAARPAPPPPPDEEFDDNPPDSAYDLHPELDARMTRMEEMFEQLVHAQLKQAEGSVDPEPTDRDEPSAAVPWCNNHGEVLPPAFLCQYKMGGFTTQGRYHHAEVLDGFVVLALDVRDSATPRVFPDQSDNAIQMVVSNGKSKSEPLLVKHIGLQFSIGPLDVVLFPYVPPAGEGEDDEQGQPAAG